MATSRREATGLPPGKRLFDIGLSVLGLLASAPLWPLIAAAIRAEDGGPVLYRQQRVGAGGRAFAILKFRSMRPDAERESGPVLAAERDPRVTRVGRLLRATALDELPQLVNILRGDLSFVGPRPERPEFVAEFVRALPEYALRLAVPPGLTGMAQLFARYDSSPRQKLRLDLLYLRRRSFWLDLRLIALSFWVTLRGRWESRAKKL
jgi:lipopolysaccharide/colanic/teichoic acid biosynthesis glycosyltransferase